MEDWLIEAHRKLKVMPPDAKELREAAEQDLFLFAQLVNPGYVYGSVHQEIYKWMEDYSLFGRGDGLTANKLIMLPRAHLKSHMVATWCAWMVTRHPEVTMLYVSATSELAETQLFAIQNIMASSVYMRYWPEYINPQEGKRERWSQRKLSIDHSERRKQGIRDATIATAGLTTNTTGWHADVIVGDDLVVPENAYTEDGREGVSRKASQFTSIRNAGGFTMACGTRYHPSDIYDTWKNQAYDVHNADFEIVDRAPVWSIKEFVVESDGLFIWPRTARSDGKAFGFDPGILARIKAEYSDYTQFYAQYYNDPNDPGSARLARNKFQYLNPRKLSKVSGNWQYNGYHLNVYAAIDFAFSYSKRADFTAIVVIGIDQDNNIYVLDLDRFKSDKISEYFSHIIDLHSKWHFKKLRAEVTVAQAVIARDLRDKIKQEGLRLSIEEHRPSKSEGSKEERISAALEHRYDNLAVWHTEGGFTNILEEELVQARPKHDDLKDTLAMVVEMAVKPMRSRRDSTQRSSVLKHHSRFGGVKF